MVNLVTGATGFLGRHLCRALLRRGEHVLALEHDQAFNYPVRLHEYMPLESRLLVVRGDVRDGSFLRRVLAKHQVERVFHLAAQSQVGIAAADPSSTNDTNRDGTWAVLSACLAETVKRVVVASSDKVYGECKLATEDTPLSPQCPYSESKQGADAYARMDWKPMQVAITRCANLYGPGDLNWRRIVPEAIRCGLLGRTLTLRTDGTEIRDYMHVEDAVAAYMLLADSKEIGPFNFSGGKPCTVLELLGAIQDQLGYIQRVYGETTELRCQTLDCDKAKRVLGWEPRTSLEAGLRWTIAWYRRWLC